MQKGVLIGIFVICLVLTISFISAAENITSVDDNSEQAKVNKAYNWLEDKVEGNCGSLSIDQQIFSLLALSYNSNIKSECRGKLVQETNQQCWPKGSCNIKTTAQAILALNKAGDDTEKAEEWLLSQNKTPTDLIWYLEIDSNEATTCNIKSGAGQGYAINIDSEKKLSGNAGGCLTLEPHGYWLRVASSCYDKEFEISCDKGFLTTLLYSRQGSSTIYVSETVHEGSAGDTTKEKIESFCFKQGGNCNYEGSLWAANVLSYLGRDVSSFLPYLIAASEDTENKKYLPDSFLYSLTGQQEFYIKLLNKQKDKHWDESGEEFYDTPVAMLSLYGGEDSRITDAKNWLLDKQDKDGSWRANIRNTAFILAAVWPKVAYTFDDGDPDDCISSNLYCVPQTECDEAQGNVLNAYECAGLKVCCDKQKTIDTCAVQGGAKCDSSTHKCSYGGSTVEASDITSGQICCVGGTCEEKEPEITATCTSDIGTCRITSCRDDEEEKSSYTCQYETDKCCAQKQEPPKNWLWIWIFLALIVLVIIGIIFRDKLREVWFKTKSRFGGKKGGVQPPRGMPPTLMPPGARLMPRRILPPGAVRPIMRPIPSRKPESEMEEVLKKLKAMGK